MKLIHELARETGLPVATIRFYEKSGLLKGQRNPEVKSNNYRYYDDEALYRLELIRDAKSIGFSLAEIRQLIDAWYSKRLSPERKLRILDEKMEQIELKIKELRLIKKQIAAFRQDIIEQDC